jgi:hypothetical protein
MAPTSFVKQLAVFVLLSASISRHIVYGAPTGTSSAATPTSPLLGYNAANGVVNQDTDKISFKLVPGQTDAATIGASLNFNDVENPQPIRGSKGGTDPGPQTEEYSQLNPDKLAPPGTDHGAVKNAQVGWFLWVVGT